MHFCGKSWKNFSQTLKYSEKREKSEIGGEIHHWLCGMDAPACKKGDMKPQLYCIALYKHLTSITCLKYYLEINIQSYGFIHTFPMTAQQCIYFYQCILIIHMFPVCCTLRDDISHPLRVIF